MTTGGGIPPDAFEKIWCYLYTTGDPVVQAAMIGDTPAGGNKAIPLAGLGYGLPLSRLYSRYFGGDMELTNHWGHGVEATVRLSRLGDRKEPLV
jgi:pyruvate dehydrogenase kinase 2/3/4